ncbi:CAP domain-containing protein [Candidatus Saccharibacteria bacterium]|nr:CAP domain-containing protein [Candidatus Saccharibacteria bacterium]
MTAAAALKQTRMTILLSVNAAAILIAGVLVASAIWGGKGEFRAVNEHSDEVSEAPEETELLKSVSDSTEGKTITSANGEVYQIASNGWISSDPVPSNELWNESSVTIYQTADIDICVGGNLSGLGSMYWQSSDQTVISGFYSSARSWLGYSSETCRFPIIKGTGTTTITAGTYDGKRHDSILVTVVEVPVEQWKHEVFSLVNEEREKNGLSPLSWGTTCEAGAAVRARELMASYSHTRPDGSSWETACPIPESGGWSGENLMAGNAAVSPASVVTAWMNSPDHRANILNENFTHLSVGFIFDPDTQYKTYWSQFFSTY